MRRMVLALAVIGLLGQPVGTAMAAPGPGPAGHDHASHDHGVAELPTPDAARGVVNRGLQVATEGPCIGLLEVVDVPGAVCTHGPDPAASGMEDVRTADLEPEEAAAVAGTAPAFTCAGDGTSGRRAHAIYAVTPDRTDRFATYEASFKAILATVQDQYRQSSLLHGATEPLVYRFTHTPPVDGSCEPLVDHVVLPSATDDDSFGATIAALKSLGYTDPSRRYLVFADANLLCGIGQMYADDRADPTRNWNNVEYQPLFSRVDAGCWNYAETHELTHNLGAVQSSALHASGNGHCNDDHDLMCYADGGPLSALFVAAECGQASLWEKRLDCGGDDYFHPAPAPGSYLASHWNSADSGWLFTEPSGDGSGGASTGTSDDSVSGDGTSDDGTSDGGGSGSGPVEPANRPTVAISAPTGGVTTTRTVTLRGTAADVDGDLTGVRLFVDGARVATLSSGGTWSRTLTVAPGERVLSAQAVDERGNTSRSTSVTVTALDDLPSDDLFRDDDTSPFESTIERLAAEGVTRGCNPPTNDRFCPDDAVTRGQMAAFLSRALGLPAGGSVDFADDDRSVFEPDIQRLAWAGITRGCSPTRFCPDDVVTRGQMAAFLSRALGLPAGGSVGFVDDDRSVFEDDIERLAAAGITHGCNPPSNDRFCPDDPVTRGQMAAFLTRALYS